MRGSLLSRTLFHIVSKVMRLISTLQPVSEPCRLKLEKVFIHNVVITKTHSAGFTVNSPHAAPSLNSYFKKVEKKL